jgi:acyl carrier protein
MEKLLELVIEAVREVGDDQDNDVLRDASEKTRLFGENLDSMGIVFLITDLESRIAEEYNLNIALADERAMSQKTSPFRSVKTLVRYTKSIIKEAEE